MGHAASSDGRHLEARRQLDVLGPERVERDQGRRPHAPRPALCGVFTSVALLVMTNVGTCSVKACVRARSTNRRVPASASPVCRPRLRVLSGFHLGAGYSPAAASPRALSIVPLPR